MPKYMFKASYRSEGAAGVLSKGGASRRDAIAKAAESVGGKLESFYFAFGGTDAYVVVELPDNATAASMALPPARSTSSATMLLVPSQMLPRCASRTSRGSAHSSM